MLDSSKIKKLRRPSELLGYKFEDPVLDKIIQQDPLPCKFTENPCIKKTHYADESGKRASSGICSAWYNEIPHITCSNRQKENSLIFKNTSKLILKTDEYILFPEKGINPYGRFDYIIANNKNNKLNDFFAMEIVSIDTTSTRGLNEAVEDRFYGELSDKYKFGLNFAHTIKLMITQLILKGLILEKWNKKNVWVLQDVLYDYLKNLIGLELQNYNKNDSIVFYITEIDYKSNNKLYELKENRIMSTNVSDFKRKITLVDEAAPKLSQFTKKLNMDIKKKRFIQNKLI